MIDPNKLQYFTAAAWLRGYAQGLDKHRHETLIYEMNQAADLLQAVWDEHNQQDEEKPGGTD